MANETLWMPPGGSDQNIDDGTVVAFLSPLMYWADSCSPALFVRML
jgi:hypothetical protein